MHWADVDDDDLDHSTRRWDRSKMEQIIVDARRASQAQLDPLDLYHHDDSCWMTYHNRVHLFSCEMIVPCRDVARIRLEILRGFPVI